MKVKEEILDRYQRHARGLSPYPPLRGGGALGESGIKTIDKQFESVRLLDSR